MKPILMAPRMAAALRNTKVDSWPAEPIDATKPFKWQTRRTMKLQPYQRGVWDVDINGHLVIENANGDFVRPECPYGRKGDVLYVKENYKYHDWSDEGRPWIEYADGETKLQEPDSDEWAEKLMDIWSDLSDPDNYAIDGRAADRKWRSSIHMPRWASRTHLKIEGIRIERLRDISEADAIAEGIVKENVIVGSNCYGGYHSEEIAVRYFFGGCQDEGFESAVDAYAGLWESINGAGSWDANPWVWVLEFRRVM